MSTQRSYRQYDRQISKNSSNLFSASKYDYESGLGSSMLFSSETDPLVSTPLQSTSTMDQQQMKGRRWRIGETLISPLRLQDDSGVGENQYGSIRRRVFSTTAETSALMNSFSKRRSNVSINSPDVHVSRGAVEFKFDGSSLSSLPGDGWVRVDFPGTARLVKEKTHATPKIRKVAYVGFTSPTKPARSTLRRTSINDETDHHHRDASSTFSHDVETFQTPSKILEMSPSRAHVDPGSLLDTALTGLTSTPVTLTNNSMDAQSAAGTYRRQPDLSWRSSVYSHSVGPSTSADLTSANLTTNAIFPRTPTPFKKAYAAAERKHGRIDPLDLQKSPQLYEDLKEIIVQDVVLPSRNAQRRDHIRRRQQPNFLRRQPTTNTANDRNTGDRISDINSTPSKILEDTNNLLASPFSTFVSAMDKSPTTKTRKRQYAGEFIEPEIPPRRLSSEWIRITCGRTDAQLELTEMAKTFLGLTP